MGQRIRLLGYLLIPGLLAVALRSAFPAPSLIDFGRDGNPVPENSRLFPVRIDGLYGFINKQGKLIVEPRYREKIDAQDRGYAVLGDKGWALLDLSGEHDVFHFSGKPESVWHLGDGLFLGLFEGGTWFTDCPFQYCDLRGKFPSDFDGRALFTQFGEGLLPAVKGGKWGYVRRNGTWAIEPKYRRVYEFSDGSGLVRLSDTEWGYIDKTGSFAIKRRFAYAKSFREGLAVVYAKVGDDDYEAHYINRDGERAFPATFRSAVGFWNGLARVSPDRKSWGYIDRTGEFVIAPQFERAESFSCGLGAVRDPATKQWLYIDRKGRTAIRFQDHIRFAENFYKGLARVGTSSRVGYIDNTGSWVWWRMAEERDQDGPGPRSIP